ncbi:conserved hypothetical protein [Rubrivivax sp. A210]|uniref:hypothetical protein n=1 Tax=Rubrivivax sp. A210 TaxID=2772301 RepID=UPI00191A9301|nr:hypothetical protein [Rubrivivax sp. A210]CAD5369168.1 conserved hypothetical protein [Rubrivivax sp. A210]
MVAELGVRVAGMVDLPIYHADASIGYIPAAGQRGSFLNKNDWIINSRHMGAEEFVLDPVANLLLVGDSIVWGGNPYARAERLGPQLERRIKGKVWPISAGSWSLQNELTYLQQNPDVVDKVDTIAFVLNNGDLAPASSWSCTRSHPLTRPVVALWYLADKHVLQRPCEGTPPELKVESQDVAAMLAAFMAANTTKRVIVFLYPDKQEAADETLLHSQLEAMESVLRAAGVQEVVSVGRDARWRGQPQAYKDAIHPSPHGMGVLAAIMATALESRAGR